MKTLSNNYNFDDYYRASQEFKFAILGFIFADKIMGLIISAGSPELVALATEHFKIMSPIILIGGIDLFFGLML